MNTSVGFDADRTAHLVQVLEREVAKARLPGAVALIARHGQLVLHRAVGQQNPADGTPMALDSIFRIYSMTKPLVSVAVMQLMERGLLLLSDPVAQHLPAFANVPVATQVNGETVLQPPKTQPTVQDLLRHTSGLTYEILGNDPIQVQYAKARLGSREHTNAQFAQALAQIPYRFEPGTVWEYSRATDLLGALVERVTGQTLGAYLQQHILGPLGMVDTAFVVPPAQHHRIAEPFAHDPDGGVPMRLLDPRKPAAMEAGGAGLMSTASDYARFLQCLLSGGAAPNGPRILSPATVRTMTADHLGSIEPYRAGRSGELLPPGHGFGLGFAVRTHDGLAAMSGSKGLYYWGGIAGTTFFVDPAKDFFAILMTQAPNQRDYYRPLFRNLVYAALLD
ncbi:serine hydrolase domain-containing protein [Rhodoferax saidenbachensis]|uniref:CubicO group peptidase (Beta-lactamase class C family) n=1 Tax=Rhodoferax saidenbachensis TaxID=1484693 RepID=A0ABU1ZU19_9BURK|nr:serine hydrolase domain-containing protein [Rhodoferax saidenbachensis]MDR7308026.1 CubicO group peptidase (beta-lactamase class C family) [Rhodoferax saidenbachensis]